MKTIVFDLKNTLLDENGTWRKDALQALSLSRRAATNILYTMNEPWTYQQLIRYSADWRQFDAILLVGKKQKDDINFLQGDVLVVGDSDTEELRFGRELGYEVIDASNRINIKAVERFIRRT